ncbi:MAG TPA: cupin domain-containing protein [Saprospiraceae bacterium]|nr:cupin domain-containing protein [Saprospiraceae bacterium]
MLPSHLNIENETLKNTDYRRVIYTVPKNMQLVLMSIPKGKDIPSEIHPHTTQFIRIEKGLGIATIDGKEYGLGDGIELIIPPGFKHRIQNVGKTPLKLYTIYTPPEHRAGLVQQSPLK